MTREEAETVFAKVLLDEEVLHQDLCEAIVLAIEDMHKIMGIEEIVR